MSEDEKKTIIHKRNSILNAVKDYAKPINSILLEIFITTKEYYDALKLTTDNYFQIHFKQQHNSCFVNNYFVEGVMSKH